MRLDGLVSKLNIGTRSEAKKYIKAGKIKVNGVINTDPSSSVNEEDEIEYNGKAYIYQKFVYYMLNKPKGCVSATKDNDTTVINVFLEAYKIKYGEDLINLPVDEMFPMGRLDKDTVGLLIITNDGEMSHKLLSYKYHVEKKYYAELDGPLSDDVIKALESGVTIEEGVVTKPAKVEPVPNSNACYITICEGKYHQVKRMFEKMFLKVTYLKRVSFGGLELDEELREGDIRKLNENEIEILKRGLI